MIAFEEKDGTTDVNINSCDVAKCLLMVVRMYNTAMTLDTRIFVRSHIYHTVEACRNIYRKHISIKALVYINISVVIC